MGRRSMPRPPGSVPSIRVCRRNRHVRSSVSCASVSRVLGRSTLRVLRALRPRWREVTGLRARAACPGTDALTRRQLSLNRRSPWTSKPSSPSGADSCRRASFRTQPCAAIHLVAFNLVARVQHRSRPTASTPSRASPAEFVERNPASAAGPRWSQKAGAVGARTGRGWKETSSAHGAATSATSSATSSAPRSART